MIMEVIIQIKTLKDHQSLKVKELLITEITISMVQALNIMNNPTQILQIMHMEDINKTLIQIRILFQDLELTSIFFNILVTSNIKIHIMHYLKVVQLCMVIVEILTIVEQVAIIILFKVMVA